jgi:DNA-3-methyladenine glycosylase II
MKPKVFNAAMEHLQKDSRLGAFELKERKPPFKRPNEPFHSLIRSIIYQQLSGKAAGTILKNLLSFFDDDLPTPQQLLKVTDAKFRKAGVSSQKVSYLRDLSKRFIDGTIDPTNFKNMTDEEIREHLLVVKGVGRWTADMFLMFTLYRPDVLPTGDLAIQKGFKKVFKLRTMPDAAKMIHLAKPWQPYRTVACWRLWEMMDAEN